LHFCRLLAIMTRGNQRDKAREKNLKEQSAAVRAPRTSLHTHYTWLEVGREGRRRQTLLSNGPPILCHVCFVKGSVLTLSDLQKKKNTLSGTEFQKAKEAQAAIMRQKQEAGEQ
jgi:hypothetical protein